jgi:hypothetical protein
MDVFHACFAISLVPFLLRLIPIITSQDLIDEILDMLISQNLARLDNLMKISYSSICSGRTTFKKNSGKPSIGYEVGRVSVCQVLSACSTLPP